MILPSYQFGIWLGADFCFLAPPFGLLVEWREVRKRLPPVRRVEREDLPGGRLLQAASSHPTMEKLRAYCNVLDNIDLKLMEDPDESTLGGEHNVVFFTREHLAAGLCFPMPAIVKQFLHFTRAPPALIHPSTIRILIGCSVLNLLHQLDLSLVEICFTYFLEGSVGWPDVHVCPEFPTAVC